MQKEYNVLCITFLKVFFACIGYFVILEEIPIYVLPKMVFPSLERACKHFFHTLVAADFELVKNFEFRFCNWILTSDFDFHSPQSVFIF